MDINQLHKSAQRGDSKAEKQLFQHLTESFRLFSQQRIWDKNIAEEIAQNALMVVFKKYKEVEIERSFTAWAYKVLENSILDYIKSKAYFKNQPTCLLEDNYSYLSYKFDPGLKSRIIKCFKELFAKNNRFARVLNLKYHGYTTLEICEMMKITENNLYIMVSRARSLLESCINKKDN